MRIVVNGQQAFGKAVLEALIERGENVIAVYCAPDKGGRVDPLKEAALAHGIPVHQPASFKDPAVIEAFRALAPDICLMAYVVLLVPKAILEAPRLGTIQYHPSLLPRHRGPSSINWPIIQGETKTGLTIFWPDEGLDTGPILLQKEVQIGPDDTLGSLYFERLFPMGVEAMIEALEMVKAGTAPRIPQDESQATYESWCRKEDVEIDWSRPVGEVYNLIRGSDPQPGAWTRVRGRVLQLYEAKRAEAAADARPGTVIAAGREGITVAASGGALTIRRVRPEGAGKVAAGDFVAEDGVAVGDVLG